MQIKGAHIAGVAALGDLFVKTPRGGTDACVKENRKRGPHKIKKKEGEGELGGEQD